MADEKLIYIDKSTGLYRADRETIKNSLKQAVKNAYGDVLLEDNYPDGIIINDYTDKFDDAFSAIQTIYNMLDINNAEGVVLDTLGNIRNEHRKEATYSYLYVNIIVPQSCTFIANTLTLKDESNNIWTLTEDVEITVVGEQGSGVGKFQSYIKGAISEPKTLTIASIDNSIPVATENIGLIDNGGFELGNNEETDIEFRNRMNTYTVFNSITLKDNLSSKLTDLTYIKDVKVYYNNSTLNLVTKGNLMTIPSGKILILIKSNVDFTVDADKRQEVFNIIENYKGLGTLCWLPNTLTIDASVFSTAVSDTAGTYEFEYDGTNWKLNASNVDLTDYGIELDFTEVEDDKLIVTLELVPSETEGQYDASVTYEYNSDLGNNYISFSQNVKVADGISQFLTPTSYDISSITLRYIKTNLFNDSPITNSPVLTINASVFSTAVSDTAGTYEFEYDGTNWKLNASNVDLTDYGITIEGVVYSGDSFKVILTITNGTPSTVYSYHSEAEATTLSNIKNVIKIYIDNKGIGADLTEGDLINYLYSSTNEIYVASISIAGAVNGTLTNNDKILKIDLDNIVLTEV